MAHKFYDLFPVKKPVIGMIHLAGQNGGEKVRRALEEILIFENEGINGAIIENYHGSTLDVVAALSRISERGTKLILGVNILKDSYRSFEIANRFGAKFVQFDSVQPTDLMLDVYDNMRRMYPSVSVLGGVRFKYTRPTGNPLKKDLNYAMQICEAVVTTGEGTGMETPIEKLKDFRRLMGDYPLIVGAGLNAENAYWQLGVADGAIVGSFFKNGDTQKPIDIGRVKKLMLEVRKLR